MTVTDCMHFGKLQVGNGKDRQLFPTPLRYVQLGSGRPVHGTLLESKLLGGKSGELGFDSHMGKKLQY